MPMPIARIEYDDRARRRSAWLRPVRRRPRASVAALLATTLIALAGCSTPAAPGSGLASLTPSASAGATAVAPGSMMTRQVGGVAVEVTWPGAAAGLAFQVELDNHMISLDGLDFRDATVTNDRGETRPSGGWSAPMGGHHRGGALVFGGDAQGFLAGARWIQLTLPGIGDAQPQDFRWDLSQ